MKLYFYFSSFVILYTFLQLLFHRNFHWANSWQPPAQEYIQTITHPKQPMNISHQLQAEEEFEYRCHSVVKMSPTLLLYCHKDIHSQWIPPEATYRLLSIYSSEKYFKILCFCTPLTIASVTRYSFT